MLLLVEFYILDGRDRQLYLDLVRSLNSFCSLLSERSVTTTAFVQRGHGLPCSRSDCTTELTRHLDAVLGLKASATLLRQEVERLKREAVPALLQSFAGAHHAGEGASRPGAGEEKISADSLPSDPLADAMASSVVEQGSTGPEEIDETRQRETEEEKAAKAALLQKDLLEEAGVGMQEAGGQLTPEVEELVKGFPSYIDLPPFAKTGQESRPATYLPLNVPSRPTEEQEDITASVSHFMNFPRVSATSTSRSAGTRERTVLEGRKKEKHQTRVMDSKKKHVIKDKKQKKKEKKHKGTPSSSSSSTSNSSSSESSTSSPLTSAGQAET
uniref:Uncharacterized protein n=1 Tax=Chromera velia CCMP2878 TaxID=1169474 RepID=A0A0G4HW51_9ALVE|eukprot:Cvel_8990.t1-p1 / transcript=Cvel_8990.t1 / gene=Cvel_8990 / organism=Chromera_velia_CCMP2878 / gene_product=hypothetical protein / transcript_product=hypothetical protein / location=Cvel_scaffold507:67455-76040(-) / protein_length=327 / sequence_SO=supercontig / SO=protein_coding / is_pseudo=false